MKKCNICKETKSLSEFYKQKNGIQYCCKICKLEKDKIYYENNKDKINSRTRQYSLNNKEKTLSYKEKWRNQNKEKKRISDAFYRQNNKEKRNNYNKAWILKNPGWKIAKLAEYRAKKKKYFIEKVDPQKIYERDLGLCQICGLIVESGDFHLDHKIPISKNGQHSYENCQTAHAFCNQSKSNKLPGAYDYLWKRN